MTNFSMLEYMLIRPLDRTIFRQEHLFHDGKPRLKMVVLDEAHVYVGAQAAEMHMLLRRAADRFGTSLAQVQGFATSATLSAGAGMDPSAALREYAHPNVRQAVDGSGGHRRSTRAATHEPAAARSRSRPDAPDLVPGGELVPAELRTIEVR
ncbi:MAG: hypothetical protein IPQ07_16180 [Myxococcales bacterium]|nr:hypothetical protein [Myxococcales bacterium]